VGSALRTVIGHEGSLSFDLRDPPIIADGGANPERGLIEASEGAERPPDVAAD